MLERGSFIKAVSPPLCWLCNMQVSVGGHAQEQDSLGMPEMRHKYTLSQSLSEQVEAPRQAWLLLDATLWVLSMTN